MGRRASTERPKASSTCSSTASRSCAAVTFTEARPGRLLAVRPRHRDGLGAGRLTTSSLALRARAPVRRHRQAHPHPPSPQRRRDHHGSTFPRWILCSRGHQRLQARRRRPVSTGRADQQDTNRFQSAEPRSGQCASRTRRPAEPIICTTAFVRLGNGSPPRCLEPVHRATSAVGPSTHFSGQTA